MLSKQGVLHTNAHILHAMCIAKCVSSTFLLKKIRLKPGLATHTFENGMTCISDVGKNVSSLILTIFPPPSNMSNGCLTNIYKLYIVERYKGKKACRKVHSWWNICEGRIFVVCTRCLAVFF